MYCMITFAEVTVQTQEIMTIVTQTVVFPILILFIGIILGVIIKNASMSLGKAIELDVHVQTAINQPIPATELLAGLFAAITYGSAVILALLQAGILLLAAQIVGGFLLILGILGGLLGLKDYVQSLWLNKNDLLGKTITVQNIKGTVIEEKRTGVLIQSTTGQKIFIPYKQLQ